MEELDAQSTSDTEYHKSAKRRRLSSDKGRQQFVGGSTKHTTSSNDISVGSQGTHLASEFDNSETTSHSDVKRPHTSESFDSYMYLFMCVLRECIFFPKIHFGSRGYSFSLI